VGISGGEAPWVWWRRASTPSYLRPVSRQWPRLYQNAFDQKKSGCGHPRQGDGQTGDAAATTVSCPWGRRSGGRRSVALWRILYQNLQLLVDSAKNQHRSNSNFWYLSGNFYLHPANIL
jgi:hypothetical protein